MFVFTSFHPLIAGEISHRAGLELISLWGESSYEITFSDGVSRLEWPMDMRAMGATYTFNYNDFFELDLLLATTSWQENKDPMKDYDWIDESFYPGTDPHEGADIFSASDVDSKIFTVNTDSRLFLFSYKPVSLALLGGYNYQEVDYRTFNTTQVGYGPWQDQTSIVNGPTTTYALEIQSFKVGGSCRFDLYHALSITIDASILPYVEAMDEDNHIRRLRVSQSECTGAGTAISMTTRFHVYKNWDLHTRCIKYHISTSGDQTQYWYGDDPATPNYDDTGSVLKNIDAEIRQNIFLMSLGVGCSF
jgi:hypothetical protein